MEFMTAEKLESALSQIRGGAESVDLSSTEAVAEVTTTTTPLLSSSEEASDNNSSSSDEASIEEGNNDNSDSSSEGADNSSSSDNNNIIATAKEGEEAAAAEEEEEEQQQQQPKLKAILKREKKLLEQRKELDVERAKISEEKSKLEENLKKYNIEELEKIQKVHTLLKDGKGKKELFELVGVSPKEFLKKSFEFNPEFVRSTFKEFLEGKEFKGIEDTELSEERQKLEEDRKALEAEKYEKRTSQTKETLYNNIDFSKSSVLSAIPKEEVLDALYDTAVALVSKRPELKSKSLKDITAMVAPAIEQVYKRKYEKLADALMKERATSLSSSGKVNNADGKVISSNSKANKNSTTPNNGNNSSKGKTTTITNKAKASSGGSGLSKEQANNLAFAEIAKLAPRDRAKALMEAGLL